ncbi:CinA family protein [Agromyces sp. LHK192]|uniref:CinA family protein n=1 Tax=Agromyces sp. LHK192 TaxID=2498704 RepID=UPI000FDA5DA1|nr:CinA family protein [Agromyces sp. LHK192]
MTDAPAAANRPSSTGSPAAELVAMLTSRGCTVAVAESLTGGLLAAEIVAVPGASVVFNGGVVAYATAVKASLLGVDAALLAERGAVDAEVARQMARGAREALAVDGRPADFAVATTGAAGPDPQDGKAPGTVFIAVGTSRGQRAVELALRGSRQEIREETVRRAVAMLLDEVVADAEYPV